MFLVDEELAKAQFADRILEAEQERIAHVATAAQPNFQARLRARVGDALIELGNRVKTPVPSSTLAPECKEQWG